MQCLRHGILDCAVKVEAHQPYLVTATAPGTLIVQPSLHITRAEAQRTQTCQQEQPETRLTTVTMLIDPLHKAQASASGGSKEGFIQVFAQKRDSSGTRASAASSSVLFQWPVPAVYQPARCLTASSSVSSKKQQKCGELITAS